MSIKLMSEIWDNQDPQLTGSKLVIMLCLADHANDDGECWPSIARLAERARIAPANVTRHIKELEAAGYLIVTRTSGTHNTYVVSATPGASAPPPPAATHPPRQRHPTPRASAIVPPRASAIPPRAPAQYHPARQRNPPRAPAQGLPTRQRALNHQLTIKNHHKNHQGNRQRARPLKFPALLLRTAAPPDARRPPGCKP